ncbi:hypothetical protein VTO42DRAFT_5036 [Malbranchea cinnamomea]
MSQPPKQAAHFSGLFFPNALDDVPSSIYLLSFLNTSLSLELYCGLGTSYFLIHIVLLQCFHTVSKEVACRLVACAS